MKILSGGWEDRAGHVLRVWVDVPPKRNGEPNAVAAMQALRLASHVNPDAYDPAASPSAMPEVVPHSVAEARMRDLVPPEDDEGEPYPIPGCATGACRGE